MFIRAREREWKQNAAEYQPCNPSQKPCGLSATCSHNGLAFIGGHQVPPKYLISCPFVGDGPVPSLVSHHWIPLLAEDVKLLQAPSALATCGVLARAMPVQYTLMSLLSIAC